MAVKTAQYTRNQPTASALGTANAERGPSEAIWACLGEPDASIEDFFQEPRLGHYLWDDFDDSGGVLTLGAAGQYGRWATFAEATRPTITDDGIVGGGWKLAASTTAHDGVSLSTTAGSYQFVTTAGVLPNPGRMFFECRVKLSSIAASTIDMFIGLMDTLPVATIVPITATGGSLSTTPNLFGFHARGGATNPGDFSVAYNVASGTVQYPTGLTNLVNTVQGSALAAATYVKLGFIFDPTPSAQRVACSTAATSKQTVGNVYAKRIRFFVNGVECSTFLINDDIVTGAANNALFPAAVMGPVIAWKQQSTTASISGSIDWIRVAQQLAA
jgi:hypothetical protein